MGNLRKQHRLGTITFESSGKDMLVQDRSNVAVDITALGLREVLAPNNTEETYPNVVDVFYKRVMRPEYER
jgi:hypothetical protein